MSAMPIRVDLRPDSPDAAAVASWRERLDSVASDSAPWLELEASTVAAERLRAVPVGPTLLLGFGGSALGTRTALDWAAGAHAGAGEVRVLDTLETEQVADCLEWAAAKAATLITVSKSGRTVAVSQLLAAALERLDGPRVFVSDPGPNDMDEVLRARGPYERFDIPAPIGGRYSIFTAVGQVPLRAAGLDPHAMLVGARAERERVHGDPGQLLATMAWREANPCSTQVLWCYANPLVSWAAWLQQLECESLGRTRPDGSRVGEFVAVLRGPADQHSVAQLLIDGPRDKRVTIVDFASEAAPPELEAVSTLRAIERDAAFDAMTLPTARILVADRSLETLGALMLDGMFSTVMWAAYLGVDPYGQPAVESIKKRVAARYKPD